MTARDDDDGLRLSGRACFVQDAFKAELLVTTARRGDALLLCAVPADTRGLTLEQDHIVDLTRDQASACFDDVRLPAENVLTRDAAGALERAWPAILVTVAADLCGTSEWQLQTTVEYAKSRKQFDRPLGFFRRGSTRSSTAQVRATEKTQSCNS